MAFNVAMGALVKATRKHLSGENLSVCELGNQTFKARDQGHFPSTKAFYESLGFVRYVAIDINEAMDAVAMDLNQNLFEHYNFTEQFDLVTNNGTGEHLFDQKTVFENIHNLCKVGGLMLHQLPSVGWVSHGFYGIQAGLFIDLAGANGYTVERCGFANSKGSIVDLSPKEFGKPVTRHSRKEAVGRTLDRLGWETTNVFCLLRKNNDERFVVPLQGKYIKAIDSAEISARYARET